MQHTALLDLYLNVSCMIIGVHCHSRVGRGRGGIKRKLHLLKNMSENVFSNYHRSSALHTANGREKGLPVGWSRERVRTGLLCYADSKGTPPPPLCSLGVNSNIRIMGCNKLPVVFKIPVLFLQVSKNAIIFPCFVSSGLPF